MKNARDIQTAQKRSDPCFHKCHGKVNSIYIHTPANQGNLDNILMTVSTVLISNTTICCQLRWQGLSEPPCGLSKEVILMWPFTILKCSRCSLIKEAAYNAHGLAANNVEANVLLYNNDKSDQKYSLLYHKTLDTLHYYNKSAAKYKVLIIL